MRRLYEEPPYYGTIAKRARAHIVQTLSMEKAAGRVRERIQEIYEEYGGNP
jgi:hypothetical protein